MPIVITVSHEDGRSRDVVVDADPATPLRDVVARLAADLDGGTRSRRALLDTDGPVRMAGRVLDLDTPVARSGIHDGAVLTFGDGPAAVPEPTGLVTVRAVGGADAGQVWTIGPGEHLMGASSACGLRLPDGYPDVLARLRVNLDAEVCVRRENDDQAPYGRPSPQGAAARLDDTDTPDRLDLEQAPLDAADAVWGPGAQLTLWRSVLEAHPVARPDAVVQPSVDSERLDYNRPPRLLPPERHRSFRLPDEPQAAPGSALPWLTALLPAAFGGLIAFVLRNPMFLMMAAMTPIMILGSWLNGRRQGKVGHRRRMAEYRDALAATEQDIEAALHTECRDRRAGSPDPAELLLVATGPRSRLWERRRTDPDHLLVRVGLADLPSEVTVEFSEEGGRRHLGRQRQERELPDVPVTFSVARAGVVGVAGAGDWPRTLARWVLGQLAVLQSPRDVQLYLLTDPEGRRWWDWATWLPHARPQLGQQAVALVGTDAETLARRVAELSELIAVRQRMRLDSPGTTQFADPDIVVLLDGARRLRALPGVVTILQEGPAVGVYSICLDADERTLPEECGTVVVAVGDPSHPQVSLRQQRARQVDGVQPDVVVDDWFAAVGRSLSPLRDVSETHGEAALPDSSRLLDVLQLEEPSAGGLVARWGASAATTRAVVGHSLDGPFALDLAEHGPHALVAGTTGSGKSEFLQTLVASLAVANRPDAMTFVLVDYKGGAAFKDCVALPHTVGMVTDLDPHLVERALASLTAELRYREQLLADAGAKDLDDYVDYATHRDDLVPVPRLVIVIDEFASMVRELPDFVTGLVNIAQRGRSLGIHLVLATQRPSGVVSAEIRANTNLRVALRVTDTGESTDVIDARDAASISAAHPGRGYARLGHSSLIPFQTARVGGRRQRTTDVAALPEPFLRGVDWLDLGRPAPTRPTPRGEADVVTDLAVLVRAVEGATQALGIPAPRRPWLPPLPATPVAELAGTATPGPRGEPVFAWAVADRPAEQRQGPVTADLATFGHLHVIGAPRSGRSQALRTIAATAAAASSVADLHLYGLDCGNGALLPLTRLPHCGAVVQRTETERAVRLLGRLHEEVLRRQRILGEGGFADVTEQRRGVPVAERLPHVMLLIDRWEGFTGTLGEHEGGALTERVHVLMREGASAGVHLVVTGDHQLLSGRMGSLCDDKLVLRLSDRTDASLAGLNPRQIPENLPPGRGYRTAGAVETHVLLLTGDPSGPAQVAALHTLGERLAARESDVPDERRPRRVAVLPSRLTFDEAWSTLTERRAGSDGPGGYALLGVGGDELEPVGADLLGDQPTFLVAGPSRSGRSTALAVMTESLLRHGCEVVVGAPSASPMRALEGRPGVRGVVTAEAPTEDDLAPLLDPGEGPVVLVVDDAEVWRDVPARDWLRAYVRGAAGRRRGIVLAGDVGSVAMGFTGWQVDVKKGRRGALLSPPNLGDGDLVGVRLTRSALAARVVPGSALVHLGDGVLVTVQVPLLAPEPAAAVLTHSTAPDRSEP
ncbi:cell division-like protein [Phycicoccus sp. CSK15P-2]|uniref:FtsK/SpoIIIE domain-containing protein n=1 Tax=Phycicoccus sp. CSK15P-2 TaxID=2807627 RepID=UPI00194EF290|nr:FtsK/SpoIIIE domain-containing protein [Phycicoccus sp. CSK15P-2]MBM6406061.1 cell division-like protein [Phycicoccus sp. CSK15P-2]